MAAGMFLGLGLGIIISALFSYFSKEEINSSDLEKRMEEMERKIKSSQENAQLSDIKVDDL
ncbi:hypothetical protein [Oceanobacillus piezotolerans]|uniref:hypothetical protein n=1 Tax=Oceanobacillus piezotolerans TaxID=2448030 RepID=UPI0011C3B6ED|nr:hypothetical protein [Oceanobacillus piezotolerans]